MSKAEALTPKERLENYFRQNGGRFVTPAQYRRARRKNNKWLASA